MHVRLENKKQVYDKKNPFAWPFHWFDDARILSVFERRNGQY
jgi:hypothetical protein